MENIHRMLIDIILQKRYLIVFLTLGLIAFGLNAYQQLPLEAYPDIANMQVRVITQVPGKASEEVERLVTIPLEKELNGIPRSDPPRSVSIAGLSVITVIFEDGVDPYLARQQVLERIATADLPDDVKPELDPNASPVGEVYRYTVEGDRWSAMDRKVVQDWVLNRKFKSVPGIIDSTGFGGPTKTFQVELDPDKLLSLGLTQKQVADAIKNSNGSTGGSFIVRNDQDYMVRGLALLRSVDDIKDVVITSTDDGTPIHVKDVADVNIGPAIRKGQVGKNEEDDVVEGILLMRRGENPSTAVANIKSQWDSIAAALPKGMHLTPLYDRTALVHHTMETIGHNVAEGIVLVVALLMLFLFQVRSALICAAVIPLALLSAFILLNTFHVPANLLSLGAIDFGILVDGAVVMVENICRHLSHLSESKKHIHYGHILVAVTNGAREVAKPILFSTAIIFVTFLPILSFQRVEGKLFRPLAFTMNFNLIGAVVATMTIIPVLCAIVFARRLPTERTSPITAVLEKLYKRALHWSLSHKKTILAIATSAFIGSLCLTPFLGSEFLPELEEGNIWLRVTVLPSSVSLEKSVEFAHKIRKILRTYPEVTNVITQVGSPDDGTDPNTYSTIEVLVDLKPLEQWRKKFGTKLALVTQMSKELNDEMPGLQYNFSQYIKDNMDEAIAGVKGELGIKIYGPDLNVLSDLGVHVRQIVSTVPGMVDVAADHLLGQPQLQVIIDRARAARYGINADEILDIVETSVGGREITNIIDDDKRFAVILRFNKNFRNEAMKLSDIVTSIPSGERVTLSQIARIEHRFGATAIMRDENERRIAVKANIRGRDLGSAVMDAQQKVAEKIKLPPGYRIVWGGQFQRAQHAMGQLAVVVPLTLVLIFLLLYATFGSASTAALILVTVPLATIGGIVALFLTGTHFSISAGVGFIALLGVAVQNGVILVSLMRQLQSEGTPLKEAVVTGALVRMKPVMIATMVALAGLVPAAISTGIGSQSQKPFAIVIVGGLLPATILTLLLLPALYEWFEGKEPSKPRIIEDPDAGTDEEQHRQQKEEQNEELVEVQN